jgi:hypothetical protein
MRKLSFVALAFVLLGIISVSGEIFPESRCGILTGQHVDQALIDNGAMSLDEIMTLGGILFTGNLGQMEGFGSATRPNFNRLIGPDSVSCVACHNQMTMKNGIVMQLQGGSGDVVANVFNGTDGVSLAQANERNTPHIFGAGALEVLAQEMSAELQALQDQAIEEALECDCGVLKEISSKGISFGWLLVNSDGSIDRGGVDGIDSDLVIKPFGQKGDTLNLREFTVNPMDRHHGLQSEEKVGTDRDSDRDGVVNELTFGDISAVATWQATRPVPIEMISLDGIEIVESGRNLFQIIGCTQCHVPRLPVDDEFFRMSSPIDFESELQFNLAEMLGLEVDEDGMLYIPLYGDLKRHDMGEELSDHHSVSGVSPNHFITAELWGVGSTGPYLHDGRAPTLDDAIRAHGGEGLRSRNSYIALSPGEQEKVLAFLNSLRLDQFSGERVTSCT